MIPKPNILKFPVQCWLRTYTCKKDKIMGKKEKKRQWFLWRPGWISKSCTRLLPMKRAYCPFLTAILLYFIIVDGNKGPS